MKGQVPDNPWSLVTFEKFSDSDQNRYRRSAPIPTAPVETDAVMKAYRRVLADAGATLPERDSVDTRVVATVREGTGRIIDDETDVGAWPTLASAEAPKDTDRDGMPDSWERRHGLNHEDAADRNADNDRDGYTNLEEYLNRTSP